MGYISDISTYQLGHQAVYSPRRASGGCSGNKRGNVRREKLLIRCGAVGGGRVLGRPRGEEERGHKPHNLAAVRLLSSDGQ